MSIGLFPPPASAPNGGLPSESDWEPLPWPPPGATPGTPTWGGHKSPTTPVRPPVWLLSPLPISGIIGAPGVKFGTWAMLYVVHNLYLLSCINNLSVPQSMSLIPGLAPAPPMPDGGLGTQPPGPSSGKAPSMGGKTSPPNSGGGRSPGQNPVPPIPGLRQWMLFYVSCIHLQCWENKVRTLQNCSRHGGTWRIWFFGDIFKDFWRHS